jgi:hypothetical protein
VRHARLQYQSLAVTEPMEAAGGLDGQLTAKTVNDDFTRSPMLRQPSAGLEREQQEPKRPVMYQPGLPVAGLRRMRFRLQGAGEPWKIEMHRGPGQPGARMRPKPLV